MDPETITFLFFLLVAAAFTVGSLALNRALGARRRRSYLQLTTYESGQEPEGEAQIDFPSSHYVYALVFVAVDIIGFVLALWAVSFRTYASAWVTFLVIAGGFTLLALTGIYYVLRGERSVWV
jgi:NADH:ubiquinone oxidoreductase subunit 3 (subunit A)